MEDWKVGSLAERIEDHFLVRAGERHVVTKMYRGGYLGFAGRVGGEWNPSGWRLIPEQPSSVAKPEKGSVAHRIEMAVARTRLRAAIIPPAASCGHDCDCTADCERDFFAPPNRNPMETEMTDTTAADRLNAALDAIVVSDWNAPVTVKSADLRAVLALAAQSSPGAQGEAVRDWHPMRTAPKDGTEIETLCVHPTAHYSKDAFGEGWAAVVKAKWIDHNHGGWTWNGLCGVHMAWRPLATPAQSDTGDVAALREALWNRLNLEGDDPYPVSAYSDDIILTRIVPEADLHAFYAALSKPNAQGREG